MTDTTQQIGGDTASPAATPSPVPAEPTIEQRKDALRERFGIADTTELPPLPEGKALVKSSEWEDALSKRQSFNGWRVNYGDCDMHLYTADQMRDYARAAIASRPAPVAEQKPVAVVDAGDDGMFAEILPDVSVKVGQMLYTAPVAAVPEGYVLAPHYRGYAHLGTCQYIVCHSGNSPAELIIHPASEADREGRAIGTYEGIGKDEVQAEEMAVRIRFDNPEALDVLENQLRMMRELHFPESASPSQPDQSAQEVKCATCGGTRVDPGGLPVCRDCTAPAAPSAAQAAGVDMDEQLHQFRSALEIIGVGDAPDPRRTAAETLVQTGFWKPEALATTPSGGVAAPVAGLNVFDGGDWNLFALTDGDGNPRHLALPSGCYDLYTTAPAQPSADQVASEAAVRDAALAECEAICNNVHDQYHAQRLIRELRTSGEKGADRG